MLVFTKNRIHNVIFMLNVDKTIIIIKKLPTKAFSIVVNGWILHIMYSKVKFFSKNVENGFIVMF